MDNNDTLAQNEQYAREKLLKTGYKRVNGINRVTVRRMDNQLVIIEKPEVYKYNGIYIVFGTPMIDNFGQKLVVAQQQSRQSALLPSYEDAVEEWDYSSEDIEVVVQQARCSREVAISTLKKNQGDIVSSIMELC